MSLTINTEQHSLSIDNNDIFNITIKSKIDQTSEHTIPFKYAKLCKLIETAYEFDEKEDTFIVDIEPHILNIIINYLNLCKGEIPQKILKPIISKDMKRNAGEEQGCFIETFLNTHKRIDLYHLLSAANYIQCEPLLNLVAAAFASLIKGVDPSKINKILDDGSLPK